MDGGVFGLLGLVSLHRGAVEYDLRHRFHIGLREIGTTVTLSEVARLVVILRRDPSSAIAAALEGWDYPISREALILMDHFDLDVQINSDPKKGKPKPHDGRPFKVKSSSVSEHHGDAGNRTDAEVIAYMRRLGHNLPGPV